MTQSEPTMTSETKHTATPGPWRLRPMSYGYDLSIDGVTGEGLGGWFVELHSGARANDTAEFVAEFDANARLIAAAPVMRATLIAALAFLESHRSEFVRPEAPDNGYDHRIAAIRNALAVAEAV